MTWKEVLRKGVTHVSILSYEVFPVYSRLPVILSHFHFGGLAQSHAKTYTGFHRRSVFLIRCAISVKV